MLLPGTGRHGWRLILVARFGVAALALRVSRRTNGVLARVVILLIVAGAGCRGAASSAAQSAATTAAPPIQTCWVYSPYHFRAFGSEDGVVEVKARDRDPLGTCNDIASASGPEWRVTAGSVTGSPEAAPYQNWLVQCQAADSRTDISVKTLSVGRSNGGFWCSNLGLQAHTRDTSTVANAIESGEDITTWMTRLFDVGTAEFAPALSPNLATNPNANSPYAKWFAGRYGTQIPSSVYLKALLDGSTRRRPCLAPTGRRYNPLCRAEDRQVATWRTRA
jgi:hypothetical protein